MSDLRVNTRAIEDTYLTRPGNKELWNVTPVWQAKDKDAGRLITYDNAGKAKRVIDGVIRMFEAKTATEHREAVEIFEHDLLWDGPPIRISNKGHLRLATYLFKYLAHVTIYPVALKASEPAPGRHLVELDAVAVSHPHRVWWLPATLLLPSEVAKNVHFKIGVKGNLDDGLVELFTGRLTNFPPFFFTYFRVAMGILMGAIPHAFEGVLGYGFDFMDGGHFYARKRDAAFKARHPDSTNPTWDWVQDLAKDIPNWGKEQAVILGETAQAVFGKTYTSINHAVSQVINFYVWLFTSIWATLSNVANTAADFIGGGEAAAAPYGAPGTKAGGLGTSQAPGGTVITAGGAPKYYKGAAPAATTGRPVAAVGGASY